MPCSSRFLPLALLGLAAFLLAAPAFGAVGRWTPFGPPTGEIQEVLADPAVPRLLYALTKSGVYRSTDGGATWGSAGAGLPRGITALALDAHRPGTLWAADSFAVFRSRDRGAHWKRVSGADFQPFPPPPGPIAGRVLLAALPGDPAVLFYAGHGYLDLWRSADGGRTWAEVPEIADVLLLKTDPAGRVYAFQKGGTLWRSDDGGLRWRRLAALPEYVNDLAAAPGRRTVLYAADQHSLLRSRTRGASWEPVLLAPEEGSVGAFTVDPQRGTVYAVVTEGGAPGIWLSEDSGTSWQRMPGRPSVTARGLLVEPFHRTLYARSHWDLAVSRNQGRTWQNAVLSAPVPAFDSHLRFDPADPSRIFAVTGGRLFRSSDGGRTWRHLPVRPDRPDGNPAEVTDLAFDPVRPGFLYVATGRLHLSQDDGRTWTQTSEQIHSLRRLAFPSRSNLIGAGWGVSRSADRGRTWTLTLDIEPPDDDSVVCDRLAADPTDPQRLFALCFLRDSSYGPSVEYAFALWRSQDGGWTWTGFPDLRGVAWDPVHPGTVYGWSWKSPSLVRSQDGGVHWERIGGAGDHGWAALLVDPWSPEVLYGATNGYPMALKRSRDGGATWEPLQAGLEGAVTWADGLWAHPAIPHQIYVVVDGGAFYEARFPEE